MNIEDIRTRRVPVREPPRALRPVREIVERLHVLGVLHAWVCMPSASTERIRIAGDALAHAMTLGEAAIYHRERSVAQATYAAAILWRLESLWPLAWTLGFDPAPALDGRHIDEVMIGKITRDAPRKPRPIDEIIALEDRFSCLLAAVQLAQLGGENTLPAGFHPVVNGGVIHERRNALVWALERRA